MATIGFVGLGHMGLPMAINLIKAGHQVTGLDLNKDALAAFTQAGGHAATSLREVSEAQDLFITMVQTGTQVKAICLGEQGLYAHAKPHALHIECSTIDSASAREIHQQATAHHLLSVDAPVSGGVAGAEQKTLTFMVGGALEAFKQAHPILQAMGKTIIHTGQEGSGQAAKICNNMLLGITMIGVSEAFLLAEQLGLSPQKLHEVISQSSGQCWVTDRYVPVPGVLAHVPANNNYTAGFMASMMLKDLVLSQQAAKETRTNTPLGQHATALYQELIDKGHGQLDFSAIIQSLEKSNQ